MLLKLTPTCQLDGKDVAGDGLTVRAVQSTIRGLDIISFSSGNGIVLIGGASGGAQSHGSKESPFTRVFYNSWTGPRFADQEAWAQLSSSQ